MTKKHLKQLENLLQGQNFEAMQRHFLSHFGEAPDLLEQSRPTCPDDQALLEGVLLNAVAHITGGDNQVEDVRMLSLPKLEMDYGSFRWRGVNGSFFFCQSAGVGLVYLPDHSGKPGFSRFRVRPLKRAPILQMLSPWQAYALPN